MPPLPSFRAARSTYERARRRLRRAVLEPILVGHRSFRETVLNALAARGHLIYARGPDAYFYVDPSDRAVGTELVWGQGDWGRTETNRAVELLERAGRLKRGSVFVDVGANIGTQTVYALKNGAFARAIAFEPEPRNASLLRMNVLANGLGDRVTVVQAAAGENEGRATLHLHPRNKGHHRIGASPSYDATEKVDVRVLRLDAALGEAGVTARDLGLLWIDAEGYEPQVLRGLGRYASASVPLVIEWSPERYSSADRQDIMRFLTTHYSTMHWITHDPSAPAEKPVALERIVKGATDVLLF